jgi:hypothetical protein
VLPGDCSPQADFPKIACLIGAAPIMEKTISRTLNKTKSRHDRSTSQQIRGEVAVLHRTLHGDFNVLRRCCEPKE